MAIDRTASNAYSSVRYAPRPSVRTCAQGSDAQVKYIRDLVRDIHATRVAQVHAAHASHGQHAKWTPDTVAALLAEMGTVEAAIAAQLAQPLEYGERSTIARLKATLSRERTQLRAMSPAPVQASESVPAATELTPGTVYRAPDGRVFLCVLGRDSGKIYGKVWTPDGTRTADGKESGYFKYLPGIRAITGLHALTLQEAAEFGQRTGQCCKCATPLEDLVSIILGIGPVCESKYTGKARSRSAKYRAEVLASAQA